MSDLSKSAGSGINTGSPTPSIVERLRALGKLADDNSAPPALVKAPDDAIALIEEQQRQLERFSDAADRQELMERWEVATRQRNEQKRRADAAEGQLERVGEIANRPTIEAESLLGLSQIRAALHNDKGGEGA